MHTVEEEETGEWIHTATLVPWDSESVLGIVRGTQEGDWSLIRS